MHSGNVWHGLPDNILKKIYYKNALRIIGIDKTMFPD